MLVTIRDTGTQVELAIIDSKSGIDWTSDLLGNAGALGDGQFITVDDDIVADGDTVAWWQSYIDDCLTTEAEVDELASALGISTDDIFDLIGAVQGPDYGDHRSQAVRVMADLREHM